MAWQLIYTSAPRLLEAGRSGFGTVARHREISPLLVAAVERASQFSRLPGLDARRVVYSHRVVNVAGGRFHVLSAIRDAGADYTGRTNHLAHHVVAEAREVARLGVSPADVLLALNWAAEWKDAPRFLEAAEEVRLADLRPQTAGHGNAWREVTGHAAHAALLAHGEASRGAYLVAPPAADLRRLFAESLRLAPDQAWQISFTTSLQPSDEPADFRWIGVAAGTAAAAQAAQSGRPVLDLTTPATLPAVAAPAPARASVPTPAGATAVAARPAGAIVTPEKSSPAAATPRAGGDPFAEFAPTRTIPWKWIGLAVAGLAACITAAALIPRHLAAREAERRRVAFIEPVKSAFFRQPELVAEFAADIGRVPRERLPEAGRFAEYVASLGRTLEAPDLARLRDSSAVAQLNEHARAAGLSAHSAQLGLLATRLDDAARAAGEIESQDPGHYEAVVARAEAIGKLRLDQPIFAKLKSALEMQARHKQLAALLAQLRGPDAPPAQEWFDGKLATLKIQESDPAARELRALLADWTFVRTRPPDAIAQRIAAGVQWPPWLERLAKEKAPAEPMSKPVAKSPPKKQPPPPSQTPEPTAPLYFVRDRDALSTATFPELGKGKVILLREGDAPAAKMIDNAGKLRRTLNEPVAFTRAAAGARLVPEKGSAAFKPPYCIVAHDERGAEVAHVWVAGDAAKPLFAAQHTTLRRDGDALHVEGVARDLGGVSRDPLRLQLPPAWARAAGAVEVETVTDGKIDLTKLRAAIDEQLERANAEGKDAPAAAPKVAGKEFAAQKKIIHAAMERDAAIAEKREKKKIADDIAKTSRGQQQEAATRNAMKNIEEEWAGVKSVREEMLIGKRGDWFGQLAAALAIAGWKETDMPEGEKLVAAGELLEDAPLERRGEAFRTAEQSVRKAQEGLTRASNEAVARHRPTLEALTAMMKMLHPLLPKNQAEHGKTEEEREKQSMALEKERARLVQHPVMLPLDAPPGRYRLFATVGKHEITLLEIDVAP